MKKSARLLSVPFALAAILPLTTVTAQNIFIANSAFGTISEFNSSGSLVNGTWATGLSWPYGLAFDSSGNLYLAERDSGTISEFNSSGSLVNGTWASGLSSPTGLAFDSGGNLYVANRGNGTIEKFSSGGADLGAFATGLNSPSGPAFDSSGNLYVANFYSSTISEFNSSGTLIRTISDPSFGYPTFIAIEGQPLPVPEVPTWAMMGMGFAALFGFLHRRPAWLMTMEQLEK